MRRDKFQPGDRVVIARPEGNEHTKGKKATILHSRQHCSTVDGWEYGYIIEVDGRAVPMCALERELDPVAEGAVSLARKAEVAA